MEGGFEEVVAQVAETMTDRLLVVRIAPGAAAPGSAIVGGRPAAGALLAVVVLWRGVTA
jgi:hypothetical protein